MRIAWFRSRASTAPSWLDSMAQLSDALQARHSVHIIDAARAHDAVWQHVRGLFDVTVYEVTHGAGSQFILPYLFRYPGLTVLLSTQLAASRTAALHTEHRAADVQRERDFDARGIWTLLRAPVLASKLVAVAHEGLAGLLGDEYPEARIRRLVAPMAMPPPAGSMTHGGAVTFGSVAPDPAMRAIVERAAARARSADARIDLCVDADGRDVFERSDVVLDLRWPAGGALFPDAMAAMALGRVPVVVESIETADWPALDPQNWVPRDRIGSVPPVCVSIDMRDAEHSLMLSMRRLASDAPLRARIGEAAQQWWREHFTIDRAVDQMERLLEEARAIDVPPRPADWPAHLDADGTARARAILEDFGLNVDLLA